MASYGDWGWYPPTMSISPEGLDGDRRALILDAMVNVDGTSGKYPEFMGNVAAVYSHPYSMGSSSRAHYGGNAETYMKMGAAMVGLLKQ